MYPWAALYPCFHCRRQWHAFPTLCQAPWVQHCRLTQRVWPNGITSLLDQQAGGETAVASAPAWSLQHVKPWKKKEKKRKTSSGPKSDHEAGENRGHRHANSRDQSVPNVVDPMERGTREAPRDGKFPWSCSPLPPPASRQPAALCCISFI